MARGAYWKGVRLWEHFQDWDPWAQRTADAEHDGVLQPWVKIVPDSPNFRRTVVVPTVVGPRTAGHGGLQVETTIAAELLRVEAYLMANAAGAGPLSYCEDTDRKANVSGGPYTGLAVVSHGAAGGGWVPTAVRLVLVREPATGAGFVAAIVGVGSGTVTIEIPDGVSVDAGWDLVDVQLVIPEAVYDHMSGGQMQDVGPEGWRSDVTYHFRAGDGADVLIAAAQQPPVDDV